MNSTRLWRAAVLAGALLAVRCGGVPAPPQPSAPGARPASSPAREFFASPDGRSSGNGTREKPWDLKTALAQPPSRVPPGATVWLRGGTYRGRFVSRLPGTDTAPVVVRSAPGEWARIDGRIDRPRRRASAAGSILQSEGAFAWFWGFELTNSDPERKTIAAERGAGLNLLGRGNRAINLIVHDTGHPGIGFWEGVGDGGEVYGSLVWGSGILDRNGTWTRGSGIYAQNRLGTRLVTNNIWFRNFTTGINLYTESGYTNGFDVEENISFDNGGDGIWGTGGVHPMERLTVARNVTYDRPSAGHGAARFGYTSDQEDAVLTDNYFAAGAGPALELNRFARVTVRGNTFIRRAGAGVGDGPFAMVRLRDGAAAAASDWDGNTYYDVASPAGQTYAFGYAERDRVIGNALGGGWLTFDEPANDKGQGWRQWTGWDALSRYERGRPPDRVFVFPNKYEPGRAHVAVFNWSGAPDVVVDLSTVGLSRGDRFEIRDAQHYFGQPVASGEYAGDPVRIPMTGLVATPIVGAPPDPRDPHTAPEFGAFVVLRLPR